MINLYGVNANAKSAEYNGKTLQYLYYGDKLIWKSPELRKVTLALNDRIIEPHAAFFNSLPLRRIIFNNVLVWRAPLSSFTVQPQSIVLNRANSNRAQVSLNGTRGAAWECSVNI